MKDDKPSNTALLVAIMILINGGNEYGRAKLPPGCLEAQVRLLQETDIYPIRHLPWLLCNPVVAFFTRLLAWLLYPGIIDMMAFRKLWIETEVRRTLSTGITHQMLVVAAGYDTLAYRLSMEYPNISFWEVDHPATGVVKQRALKRIGCPPNLHLLHADLTTENLPSLLSNRIYFDPTKPTVVVTEGLLYYLTEEQVQSLFVDIAKIVAKDSFVVFTFMEWNEKTGAPDHGPFSRFILPVLKSIGEPFQWGINMDMVPKFFASTGWTLLQAGKTPAKERVGLVQLQNK